jgi:hypothetical protein
MTPNEVSAINIGAQIRAGLQLKTVEVVALLHNACQQLDAGSAATLHRSVDDLWVTDEGRVVLPRIARAEPARDTVASLLEDLLPKPGQGAAVPSALRTLPSRLRESGGAHHPSDLKDLLTILRWHLPADSQDVLRDLVMRARLNQAQPAEVSAIESFADEGSTLLPAAVAMAPTPKVVSVAAAPGKARRFGGVLAAAATLVLVSGAAGYATYRFITSHPQPATITEWSENTLDRPAPVEPLPGRITRERDTRAAPVGTPTVPTVAVDAHALNLPLAGGVFSPSFASSGSSLLFHAGHTTSGRLFQASLDERGRPSAITPLLEDRGRTYHARLSPDGRSIAFDSDRDGERGVYVASRDGGHVARVSGEGFAAVPTWSPDMKWLSFVRGEPSRPKVWNLWLRNVATGSLAKQTDFRSGQVWGASWFPDARSLCYSHEDRLLIAQPGSKIVRAFTSPVKGRLIRTPAVSPDGTRIVFQVYRDGAWLLDMASGEMRRILADPTAEEFAWDPDGKQIAYHSRRDGQWRIWMLTI